MSTAIGVDMAEGDDYSVATTFKRPSLVRRSLRKLRIDRSTWEYKLVKVEELK